MSTGILDQVRAPRSWTGTPGETDRRRTAPQRVQPEPRERDRTGRERAGRGGAERERSERGPNRRGTASAASRSAQGRSARGRGSQRPDRARDEARSGGTAPFVLLIMVLLTSGLVATLWLSTAAAADSYRLDAERQHARDLSEQTERLHRDVESARSAPAIAAAAQREGMVPAGEPAVLLVAPNGSTHVIGTPRAARAAPISPPPAAPRPPAPRAVADPEVAAQTGADRPGVESPAATENPAGGTSPATSPATNPAATNPAATNPAATNPAATNAGTAEAAGPGLR